MEALSQVKHFGSSNSPRIGRTSKLLFMAYFMVPDWNLSSWPQHQPNSLQVSQADTLYNMSNIVMATFCPASSLERSRVGQLDSWLRCAQSRSPKHPVHPAGLDGLFFSSMLFCTLVRSSPSWISASCKQFKGQGQEMETTLTLGSKRQTNVLNLALANRKVILGSQLFFGETISSGQTFALQLKHISKYGENAFFWKHLAKFWIPKKENM